MTLRRWLRQRWCGLTVGHLFTRHCGKGWFGEQCYLCEHRRTGIEIGPQKFAVTAKPERNRLWWVRGVFSGRGA